MDKVFASWFLVETGLQKRNFTEFFEQISGI